VTNTPAYYNLKLFKALKGFIVQAPGFFWWKNRFLSFSMSPHLKKEIPQVHSDQID
jgi:hypothetical protein